MIKPTIDPKIPIISVRISVDLNVVPIWLAVNTGVIRSAETSITPSSLTPAINAIAVPTKRKYRVRLIGILKTWASSKCIVDITSERHWEYKIMSVMTKKAVSIYMSSHSILKILPNK